MKHILILTPFYPPNIGGAETFTDELIKELIKCHKIDVLTFQPFNQTLEEYSERIFLKIYRMKWWIKQSKAWSGVSLKNILSVIPQIALKSLYLCMENKYDIIHAQGLLSGFVAVLLKKIFKIKVFITLLALYDFKIWALQINPIPRDIAKWILRNSDAIFVEGFNGKKDVCDLFYGEKRPLNNIKIFHHWCDQNVFKPPQKRPMDKVRVLFIGRPIPEKGKYIIQQAEKLLDKSKYEITYIENVSYEELPSLYQMAHIVVIPSLYPEGYSRVVIEAASCGCALITSNRGSLPEMIHGWGISCDPTPEKFAYQIQKVHLEEACKQSYDHAAANFSVKNAEVFLESYR